MHTKREKQSSLLSLESYQGNTKCKYSILTDVRPHEYINFHPWTDIFNSPEGVYTFKKNTHVPKLRTFLICKRTTTLERLLQENTHGRSQAFLCN